MSEVKPVDAANAYDAAGRVKSVGYTWETFTGLVNGGPTFSHSKVVDGLVSYDYDASTGLRNSQTFHTPNQNNAWSTVRTEEYTYDSQLDYLTGVDYNDGLASEVKTWTYDAAGNRSGTNWAYDNLNRMTTSPPLVSGGSLSAWTYEHDILGNRTRRNASTANHAHPMRYDWDVLNRATLIAQPSGGAGYAYRADGQRIEKVEGITFSWSGSRESGQYDTNYAQNRPTSRYYYDGQMGFEDDYNPSGTVTQVNRYALGPRGIDRIARTESGNTTLAYPMYDGHGNMRALLTRDGTGYDTGNWKTYDVWGSVRSGGSSVDPKQGYVASIGHVSDGESSLIYMRARYYEPATGRFISQDPAMHGMNWFTYCGSNPVTRSDPSGKTFYDHLSLQQQWVIALRFSNEFRGVAAAALAFWAALSYGEFIMGNPIGHVDRFQKLLLLGQLGTEYINAVFSGPAVADPGTRIEAYYMGYQCMLRITMIFLDLT